MAIIIGHPDADEPHFCHALAQAYARGGAAAISVLTDDCDPANLKPVNIADIIAVASRAEPALTRLFTQLIGQL